MKTTKLHVAIFLFIACFAWQTNYAQESPVYTVTTWKVTIPENGSNAELNTLLKEFQQKVVIPNNKVVSERVLRHLSGTDSRDLTFITEYANWNDIDEAATIQGELMEKAWPDEASQKEFFKKFNKYFLMHSDEIYTGMPEMNKN
ncbi:hypothetical protein [Marixanthomonas ophiurae]|uniref:Uncharacterized protein n=1 Tax=Marixanthomonas ophiurae TaxID=387659 RepID=A0A3E1QDA2_9FLAO|nr:hypothetical protein [Marixanthomonas ophiurae]RFN60087.1 hypothetical protein DZ858_08585 [Marixanthomonas ophiurae]